MLPADLASSFGFFALRPRRFFASWLRWGHRFPYTLKLPLRLYTPLDSRIIAWAGSVSSDRHTYVGFRCSKRVEKNTTLAARVEVVSWPAAVRAWVCNSKTSTRVRPELVVPQVRWSLPVNGVTSSSAPAEAKWRMAPPPFSPRPTFVLNF